ncbi:unnamed protein product [Lampetra fluviatilis]
MSVILETTLGDVVVDLYTKERPRTSLNFLKLCKVKYYNYCLFHSVQKNFIVQTGDPTGTGRGGESVFSQLYGPQARYFDAEKTPRIKHRKKGTLSMVDNGSGQHGSQFLLTVLDGLDSLDGQQHTVFGEVAEGMEVLGRIAEAFCDRENRPYQDVRLSHTVVLDDPFPDPPGLCVPDRSPEPTAQQLDSGRIGADEDVNDMQGRSVEEVAEISSEKEAKARATLLEMIGDLPDADVAPPDSVLFVCKLNPVTNDDDLEVIFSRFGPIASCEIIRDRKTGESLCYAFVEFTKSEDCERAYFKMDNVLIDDRRIHVDFSQSVAKVKWKGRGGHYSKDELRELSHHKPVHSKLALKEKAKPAQQTAGYELLLDCEPQTSTKPCRRTLEESAKHERKQKRRSRSRSRERRERDAGGPERGKKRDSERERDGERGDRERVGERDGKRGDRERDGERDGKRGDRERDGERDWKRDRERDGERDWKRDRARDGERHGERHGERDRARDGERVGKRVGDRDSERDRERERRRDRK